AGLLPEDFAIVAGGGFPGLGGTPALNGARLHGFELADRNHAVVIQIDLTEVTENLRQGFGGLLARDPAPIVLGRSQVALVDALTHQATLFFDLDVTGVDRARILDEIASQDRK